MGEFSIDSVEAVKDFCLKNHTTYGLGGNAKIAYIPKSNKEACFVYDYLLKTGTEFFVLGNGSNLLVSDSGYKGAVIYTKKLNKLVRAGDTLICGSGVKIHELLHYCKINGLGGLEYLSGIPASIGGVACMNGGSCGRFICESIKSVTVYDGKLRKFSKNECNFAIKHSTMRDINCVILEVELLIYDDLSKNIEKRVADCLSVRKYQPNGKSCGCVFKNPPNLSAGKLIDDCGLKGMQSGGAFVSPAHANFIINGGGSSADVYALIHKVKSKVKAVSGVDLEEEVVYIGDFNGINC